MKDKISYTKITATALSLHFFAAIGLTFALAESETDYKEQRLASSPEEYFAYLETQSDKSEQSNVAYQNFFDAAGYDIGSCGADGFIGYDTMMAIRTFQIDHGLPQTLEIDTATRQKITEVIETSLELQTRLDERLLKPFKTPLMQDFTNSMNSQLSPLNRYGVAYLRPDALLTGIGAFFMNYSNSPEMRDAFPKGCDNYAKMDAMRHSEAAVKIADFWLVPSFSAETALNLREYLSDNPAPVMLTDLANHKIAIARFNEIAGYDTKDIIADVKSGVFILQPFPIISPDFEYSQPSVEFTPEV